MMGKLTVFMVGQTAMSFSTIRFAISASYDVPSLVVQEQCSMQSKPASTALRMPSTPCA